MQDGCGWALSELTTYFDLMPHKTVAAWRAKYVRMMSAPARLRHMSDSIMTFSSSTMFSAPPALIIEYSPETWRINWNKPKIVRSIRSLPHMKAKYSLQITLVNRKSYVLQSTDQIIYKSEVEIHLVKAWWCLGIQESGVSWLCLLILMEKEILSFLFFFFGRLMPYKTYKDGA